MQIALAVGKRHGVVWSRVCPPVPLSGVKKERRGWRGWLPPHQPPCNIQFRYSILLAKNTTHTADSSVNRSQVERTEGEMKLPACRHLAASFSHHISLLTRFPPCQDSSGSLPHCLNGSMAGWLLASIHSNTNVLNVLITRNDFLRRQLGVGRWELTSVQTFQLGLKVLHYNTAHFIPPTQPKTFRTHARHSGCGFLVRVEIHLCDKILIAAPCGCTGKN